jgi:hypothetical protein
MPCAETSFPVANMMTLPAVPKRSSAMYSLSRAAIQEIDCLKVVTPFDAPLVREAFSPDDESEDSSLFPSHQLCLGAPRSHQPTWVDKDGAKPHQSSDNLSPKQILGAPYLARFWRDVGFHRSIPEDLPRQVCFSILPDGVFLLREPPAVHQRHESQQEIRGSVVEGPAVSAAAPTQTRRRVSFNPTSAGVNKLG